MIDSVAKEFSKKYNIHEIVIQSILNRGFDEDDIITYFEDTYNGLTPPSILKNTDIASEKIHNHIIKGSAIRIFADYDVDGLTSGYVMYSSILDCDPNADIDVYYPDRSEGYGLNIDWCKKIVKSKTKDTLVITVDNGISKVEEVKYLKDNGVDVVITDHHRSSDNVPDCIIVNPHNEHEEQSELTKNLSGCQVAFKTAQFLKSRFGLFDNMKYIPYVALSIISDVMDINIENASTIRLGLMVLNSNSCPINFKNFIEYFSPEDFFTSKDIAFNISPKLNSCGRINKIDVAKEYLFNDKNKKELFLDILKIDEERKKLEDEVVKSIDPKYIEHDNKVNIIIVEDCPSGIFGGIANSVLRKTGKPTIIADLSDGALNGSARSLNGINLFNCMVESDKNIGAIQNIGGHSMAFGISILEDKLEDLIESVNETMIIEDIEMEIPIDANIKVKDINMDTVKDISMFPFNNNLSRPVFCLNAKVKNTSLSKNNPSNIKFSIYDETGHIEIWAWKFAEKYIEEMGSPKNIKIIGEIERNFMNPKFATMRVLDIRE